MANSCLNYMRITGPDSAIYEFLDKIKSMGDNINLSQIRGEIKPLGNSTMFLTEPLGEPENGILLLQYETPWSPICDETMLATSSVFPELTFEFNYEESGNAFMGYRAFSKGALIHEEHYQDEQHIDSRGAVEDAMTMDLEEIPKRLCDFDPDGEDTEYSCPTAYNILLARLRGEDITKENFPQVFMPEC